MASKALMEPRLFRPGQDDPTHWDRIGIPTTTPIRMRDISDVFDLAAFKTLTALSDPPLNVNKCIAYLLTRDSLLGLLADESPLPKTDKKLYEIVGTRLRQAFREVGDSLLKLDPATRHDVKTKLYKLTHRMLNQRYERLPPARLTELNEMLTRVSPSWGPGTKHPLATAELGPSSTASPPSPPPISDSISARPVTNANVDMMRR